MSDPQFTDRYQALGIPYPDPATMCKDECQGTGFVPVSPDDTEEPWATLWKAAEAKKPSVGAVLDSDRWHFVCCPSCGGTGKRTEAGLHAAVIGEVRPRNPDAEYPVISVSRTSDKQVEVRARASGGETVLELPPEVARQLSRLLTLATQ